MKKLLIFCLLLLVNTFILHADERVVLLDIGHQSTSGGAQSPDKRINEFKFWLRYAGEVKKYVEEAGFPCVITNRSTPPKTGSDGVVYMNRPDKNGKRYPSRHYPEHIGAGMVSADYAVDINARCVVFLHLNCIGSKWCSKPPTGLIICNKKHGRAFAESIAGCLRERLLDHEGGIPNADRGIKVLPRFIGSQPSAGWMNVLDEVGIPAAVFEALYLDYRPHVDYIMDDQKAKVLAHTLGEGIVRWLNSECAGEKE